MSDQEGGGPAAAAPVPADAKVPKQAVIIVHGMGEQRPMDTLKSFVRTVWELDEEIARPAVRNPNMVWSKPDARSGSLELRRITTRESVTSSAFPAGVRTDFYELYWADLTAGSTWQQFLGWMRHLLFRMPKNVPGNLMAAWLVLWVGTLICTGLALLTLVPETLWTGTYLRHFPRWLLLAIISAGGGGLTYYATRYFGRVVRYTRADPDNIAARAAVRERGLKLLNDLHDGGYVRIVLASHSLGTILAYDLLSYFWAQKIKSRTISEGTPAFVAACEVERAAAALDQAVLDARPPPIHAYREAQAGLRRAIDAGGGESRWLISDFITFGSPLTHAEVLLASDLADLDARKSARELPTCPPRREELDPDVLDRAREAGTIPLADPPESTRLMMFPDPDGGPEWTLHHAAPFAAVRWTNIHDPARAVFFGDVISGPLGCHFGAGIGDVDLSKLRGQSWRFSHTLYWSDRAAPAQLAAVRLAANLLDSGSGIEG